MPPDRHFSNHIAHYRKLFRANIILKIAYKKKDKETFEGIAFSKNLSAGGMNLIAPLAGGEGEPIELTFQLPGVPGPVNVFGTIIWQSPCFHKAKSKRSYYSLGIEFENVSEADELKIADFVRQTIKEQNEAENQNIIEMIEKAS